MATILKNKVPQRKCIGCNESKPKKELIRIVKTPEGEMLVDDTGRTNGRGAYICNDPECLQKAIKTKGLNRAFKMNVDTDVLIKLSEEMAKLGKR
jgi:hypothetical protein